MNYETTVEFALVGLVGASSCSQAAALSFLPPRVTHTLSLSYTDCPLPNRPDTTLKI